MNNLNGTVVLYEKFIILIYMFFFYSFIGWFYESTICSFIKKKRFVNRGYLYGPICPIYGAGALFNWCLLSKKESVLEIFIISATMSIVIEYLTSYVMEKIFHARWWDYSHFPFNVNGRICLYGYLIFGTGNVIIIKYVQPFLYPIFERIQIYSPSILPIALSFVFMLDVIISTTEINSLKYKIENIASKAKNLVTNHKGKIKIPLELDVSWKDNVMVIKMKNFSEHLRKEELRFLDAFPNMKIKKGEIMDKVIERIEEKRRLHENMDY